MQKDLMNAVDFSHYLLEKNLKKGDTAIDATSGNGHDSKFIANLIKEAGKLYSFDIQKKAVSKTKKLLAAENLLEQVELINDDHSNLDQYIKKEVAAVIFNLGYLPGGDKNIITKSKSTIAALEKSLILLKKKGIVILVIYSGHPGGEKEKEALLNYCSKLNYKKYNILNYKFLNQPGPPPEVIAIKKRR